MDKRQNLSTVAPGRTDGKESGKGRWEAPAFEEGREIAREAARARWGSRMAR